MAARFAVDTSCIVAALSEWHAQHASAADAVLASFRRGERLVVAAPALIEAYSVLTRLPLPHRLMPADAWETLHASFVRDAVVVNLTAQQAVSLLAAQAGSSVTGGRVYDAVIAECARIGGAGVLLTLNSRHFDPPPAGVTVIDPSR